MARLNQIIAVEKGAKSAAFKVLTDAYQLLQKSQPLAGISRIYRAKDEDGETLPSESTKVQTRTQDVIASVEAALTRAFDVTATKEAANTVAKADIVVDGKLIASGVPATTILMIEKQLVDIETFVKKLPVLDSAETWTYDQGSDSYATAAVETTRTKKVPKAFVKYEATEHHPAQVDTYHEDVVVGYWRTVKFSGALPAKQVNDMLARVEKLQDAVKKAREEANMVEVKDVAVGSAILGYVFRG